MTPLIVNFHGIGTPVRPYEEGEEPYWISEARFAAVLDIVEEVSARLPVAISFDDSNESDYTIGYPVLRARGRTASFFVLAGKVGRPGYLNEAQLRELASAGFEIGSHGLDHRAWTELGDPELEAETAGSRAALESIVGRPVLATGIPFGAYDRRVLRAIARAGYERAYSSDGWPRLSSAAPTPRYSVRSDTDLPALRAAMLAGASLRQRAAREAKLRFKALR